MLRFDYPGGNSSIGSGQAAGQPGELVTFGYNAMGQLASVISDDGTQYVASTTYNAQGQAIEQRVDSGANGFTRQSVYNPSTLRLETLKAGKATPFEDLQKLAYAYDLAGNVQTLTDSANNGQVQSFGYDWLDRLTSAATNAAGAGQYSHIYAYSAIGNLTSYNGNAYTYGSQPHAVTGAFGNSYGYDAVGNQTSRTIAGVSYTQSFDHDNRLVAVTGGGVSASFLYDADGNRVKGTVGGVTTVYLAGIYEYQNGAVTKYYEGGALRRTGYAADNGVFYTLSDHLRSTSILVNQDGTVKSRNFYYPYGGNRGGGAFSDITTKRFTGQYHEQGLPGSEGLSFYNARWYDAQVGVFISADAFVPNPGDPRTFNRYAYVGGNPLRRIDPTGHVWSDDSVGGCDGSCGGGGGGGGDTGSGYTGSGYTSGGYTGGDYTDDGYTDSGYTSSGYTSSGYTSSGYTSSGYTSSGYTSSGSTHVAPKPISLPDPYAGPQYSLWRWVGGCTKCHSAKDFGHVPTNDELAPYLEEMQAKARWALEIGPTVIMGVALLVETGQSIQLMPAMRTPRVSTLPKASNAIGKWGAERVGAQLPVEIGQFTSRDPITGKTRIYDGRFLGTRNAYVEIKTTTNTSVYSSARLRGQLAIDAQMPTKPMWLFVNGSPSSGLINEMNQAGIPWHVLHP